MALHCSSTYSDAFFVACCFCPSRMPLQEFTALLVLATALSFSPGPNTTLSAAMAANHGLRRSLRFVLAVPFGWGLLLLLCATGVGTVIQAAPTLRWLIKAVGIAYLLWMAYKLWNSAQLSSARPEQLQIGFWHGVALQFVNIKAWMLALSIIAGWVAGKADWTLRLSVVLPVMLAYAFCSNLLYACVGALLRNWLAQGRRLLYFNRGMSALLAITAFWMLYA